MSDKWFAMCSAPRDGSLILAYVGDGQAAYILYWTGTGWDVPSINDGSLPESDSAFVGWIPCPTITEA